MKDPVIVTLPHTLTTKIPKEKGLVIFDGYCSVCSRSVRFLLSVDRRKKLLFLAGNKLQVFDDSETGTIIYYKRGIVFKHSDAVLELLKDIGGFWKFAGALMAIFPRKLRDNIYRLIARNRFKWFKKRSTCFLPGTAYMDRFI